MSKIKMYITITITIIIILFGEGEVVVGICFLAIMCYYVIVYNEKILFNVVGECVFILKKVSNTTQHNTTQHNTTQHNTTQLRLPF
jgi:hypothetical protein